MQFQRHPLQLPYSKVLVLTPQEASVKVLSAAKCFYPYYVPMTGKTTTGWCSYPLGPL